MKLKLLMIMMLIVGMINPIHAEDPVIYRLADATGEGYHYLEDEFDSFGQAQRFFNRHRDEYDNLVLLENDEVILMEYGIVEFKVNEGCTLNLNYHNVQTDKDNSLNGCYGVEAAYLDSSKNSNRVHFMLSDAVGYTSRENVILHPYDSLDVRVSRYTVKNQQLFHEIKTQLNADFFSTNILLDNSPAYLNDGESYFSYDGHYFYTDFKTMIDDYRLENREHAVNANEPYYNYFEYLPQRSLSNYTSQDLEDYFNFNLMFDRKLDHYEDTNSDRANDEVNRSQYVDEIPAFFASQSLYGVNALMSLSLSINESSFGKSRLAFDTNNLFGHAAFDTDIERDMGRYLNASSSIYSHAKHYINGRYCDIHKNNYQGSFFGNKNSGMNVDYTNDPYWGEKAAGYYYTFDSLLGQKDYQSYCLGLITQVKSIVLYRDKDLKEEFLTLENLAPYAFIILNESETAYKVQLDLNLHENDFYDFETNVAYVDKTIFDTILNREQVKDPRYHVVTYNADGGLIDNHELVDLKIKHGQMAPKIIPYKEGYEFIGYDKPLTKVEDNVVYKALYSKVTDVELLKTPKKVVGLNGSLDLSDGLLKVTFEDQSYKEIPLNTNMVRNYDLSKEGRQTVTVNYCGLETSYEIVVDGTMPQANKNLQKNIHSLVEGYLNDGQYDVRQLFKINDDLMDCRLNLTFEEVSALDHMIIDALDHQVNFHVNKNDDELSVSGLALATLAKNSLGHHHLLFKDTYSLASEDLDGSDYQKLKQIGEAYGFDAIEGFTLNFYKNAKKMAINLPYIIQLKVPNMDTHKIYTVYHIDETGDVQKCTTMQTKDYIRFMSHKAGAFMVFSIDTANDYQLENIEENIDFSNSEYVYYRVVIKYAVLGLLAVAVLIGAIYYSQSQKKGNVSWKDYKKSLQNAESHPEEKPKN